MRWLFTSFPAKGHFHPMAPLALAARDAGHEVVVASGPDLARWARSCGLEASSVGIEQAEALRTAQALYPEGWGAHMFTDVWVGSALPGLLEVSKSWRPEVVIHEELEFAGVLLAAMLGVPCATHSWHEPVWPSEARRRMRELLTPVWAEHMPGRPVRTTGEVYLDACPAPLQSDEIAEIESVFPVRPVPFDGPHVDSPAWLAGLPRPAVYATLGTVPVFSTPERLRLIVDAVAPMAGSVVVTTGPNPVEVLGDLAPNVRATPYLPQSLLLDHVDLLISQGGAGGTLGALIYGLPHLALPLGRISQLRLARSIQQFGAGLCLEADEQDLMSIRAAASTLLQNATYKAAATRLGRELQNRPSPDEVVAILAQSYGGRDVDSQKSQGVGP